MNEPFLLLQVHRFVQHGPRSALP